MKKNSQRTVKKIREFYSEKQPNALDTLQKLDAKVKRPANIFAYLFGSISALIMGMGMSLVMTDIAMLIGLPANQMLQGIVIGVVGIIMALINYPIYKGILGKRKKKYGVEILKLSEKISEENK